MQSRIPEITLVNGTLREQQTKDQLMHVFEQYNLEKWLYTERIQIEGNVIPHSHPVLTLNTQYSNYTQALIATYIHEQIHWFVLLIEKAESAYTAMGIFRHMYPGLPVGLPDGCGDDWSNLLHIEVNYLEYRGLTELFGSEAARQGIVRKEYYKKIYELILRETEKVGEMIAHHGLLLPERPPEPREFLQVGA